MIYSQIFKNEAVINELITLLKRHFIAVKHSEIIIYVSQMKNMKCRWLIDISQLHKNVFNLYFEERNVQLIVYHRSFRNIEDIISYIKTHLAEEDCINKRFKPFILVRLPNDMLVFKKVDKKRLSTERKYARFAPKYEIDRDFILKNCKKHKIKCEITKDCIYFFTPFDKWKMEINEIENNMFKLYRYNESRSEYLFYKNMNGNFNKTINYIRSQYIKALNPNFSKKKSNTKGGKDGKTIK